MPIIDRVGAADCEDLYELARDKSVAGRRRLVSTVADLFCSSRAVLNERERALMSEILRQLIHDVEIEVRQSLAQRLAREPAAPPELIVMLANDQIEVAHPILLHSDVLRDEELIEIIHHRTLEHQLAIALRREVSEAVVDAIVQRGEPDVIKVLLENPQARISQATIEYLVEESKRVDTYQNPLLRRPELTAELARRMYTWVSAALRKYILEHFAIDPSTIDHALGDTVRQLAERGRSRRTAAETLANRLAEAQAITPQRLVETLRQGEVSLFEAMLGNLTGLRVTLVRRLLLDPSGEGLAIACRAIGMDAASFTSIFVLSRKARHDSALAPGEVTRIVGYFGRMTITQARQLLQQWQREQSYLQAAWSGDRRS